MADILYDKALGLEVEGDELKNYNPSLVKNKGEKQFKFTPADDKYSQVKDVSEYDKYDPRLQEDVSSFFDKRKIYENYISRENLTPNDLDDLNEVQYRNQSGFEALRNGFVSRTLSILPKVMEMPGTVGGLVVSTADYIKDAIDPNVEAEFAKSLKYTYDNFWVNTMKSADDELKSLMPVFGSKYGYYSDSLLDNLHSAKFWAEDGFDGLAFTASALAPGIGWAKLLSATSKGAKATKFFENSAKFMRFGKNAKALENLGEKELKQIGIDKLSTLLTTATNTINEAALEANDIGKQFNEDEYIANKLKSDDRFGDILKLEEQYSNMPPDIEFGDNAMLTKKKDLGELIQYKKDKLIEELHNEFIKDKANAQLNTFNWNAALLTMPDYFQAKLFNKNIGKAKSAYNRVTDAKSLVRKTAIKEAGKQGLLGIGREGLWEENAQTAVQNYYSEKVNSAGYNDSVTDAMSSAIGGVVENMFENATFQDKEGAKAIILGAVSGGLTSALFGYRSQKIQNKQDAINDAIWKTIKSNATNSLNLFNKDYKSILGADGKISADNIIKSFTYALNKKSAIDSQELALLLGNDIMHNLGLNDEIARKFFEELSQVNGSKYLNDQEAIDLLKENLNQLKESKDADETTAELVDTFISKIDNLYENINKSKETISKSLQGSKEESSKYSELLQKTLFFGLNKVSEIENILKTNGDSLTGEQKESLNKLLSEYKDANELLSNSKHIDSIVDRFNSEANYHKELIKEINDEKKKPESDRDNVKIKTLEYTLSELYEINGWKDNKTKESDHTWGFDGFRMSLSPTDVVKREKLGSRDRFFYDLGRDAMARENVDKLINDDSVSVGDIIDFINTDQLLYIKESDKNKLIEKVKSLTSRRVDEYNSKYRELSEEMDLIGMQELKNEFQDLTDENTSVSNGFFVENSEKFEKNINEKYNKKEYDRNQFLGKEENATSDSFITNIRRRIALDFLGRLNSYYKLISDNIDEYSNSDELSKTINEISDRIDVFNNSDEHKDLISGYVKKLEAVKSKLESLIVNVSKNKGNKEALDKKLDSINKKSMTTSFGFIVEAGKITATDNSIFDSFKSIVGDKLFSKFSKIITSSGIDGDRIAFYKLFSELSSDQKNSIVELISKKSNQIGSLILNKYKVKGGESAKWKNTSIESIVDNPLKSPLSIFARLSGADYLIKIGNSFPFAKSKTNKKNIIDRFILHNNLDLLLEDCMATDKNGMPALLVENQKLTRNEYDSTIDLIKDLIERRNIANSISLLESNIDFSKLISAELEIAQSSKIAPSMQQRNAILSTVSWLFKNSTKNENAFQNAKLINGLAGTGKTTVVASNIFKLYTKLSGADINKSVVVLGSTLAVANNLASNIGASNTDNIKSASTAISENVINDTTEIVVIDEVGALHKLELADLQEKIRVVNESRIKSGKQSIKVLMFGDPNQVQNTPLVTIPSIQSIVDGTFSNPVKHNSQPIEQVDTLIVQYRSDVDSINSVADSFAGRTNQITSVVSKATTDVLDFKSNPKGVHAVQNTNAFVQRLKFAVKNSNGEKIIVAYNTEKELDEIRLNKNLTSDELKSIEFVHYFNIQGLTLSQLFININPSNFKDEFAYYNSIMYMLSSRPQNYLCINDYESIFDNVVDEASIEITSDRNRKQLESNLVSYKNKVSIDNDIMNEKFSEKRDEEKREEIVDNTKYEKPSKKDDDKDVDVEDDGDVDSFSNLSDDEKEDAIEKDREASELNSKDDEFVDNSVEPGDAIKIDNPTSSNFEKSELSINDDVFVLATGIYGKKTRRYKVVKKFGNKYIEVGSLSEKELKSLGLSENNFDQKGVIRLSSSKEYSADSESMLAKDTDGNNIKLSVAGLSKINIKYNKNELISGKGFINDIIARVVKALNIDSFEVELFLPTRINMMPREQNKYSHLKLKLGIPYIIINRKYYIRLEPLKFNKNTAWNEDGFNSFEVISNFTKAVKSLGDWLQSNEIDSRLGDFSFRNIIHSIAMSDKLSTFDKVSGEVFMKEPIEFGGFDDVSQNKTQSTILSTIFKGDINLFNKFILENRDSINSVLRDNFKAEKSTRVNIAKSIANGDQFSLSESYNLFLSDIKKLKDAILSGQKLYKDSIIELLSRGDKKIDDEVASKILELINNLTESKTFSVKNADNLFAAVTDAFIKNKLFPRNSSEKVFGSEFTEDVRVLRDIFKQMLKANPIESSNEDNTVHYQWHPEYLTDEDIASGKNIRNSRKHVLVKTVTSGKDVSKTLVGDDVITFNSRIQRVLNQVVRANDNVNGKNLRLMVSPERMEKTGYEYDSVPVFWEADERNNESIPENLRELHYDWRAQAYDKAQMDDAIASGDEARVRELTSKYTIDESDLEFISNGNARRQITRAEIRRSNQSSDKSTLEGALGTNFESASGGTLYLKNNNNVEKSIDRKIDKELKINEIESKDYIGSKIDDIDDFNEDDIKLLQKDSESQSILGDEISEERAIGYLKRIFPGVDINFIKFLDKIRHGNKEAYGRFVDGIIELERNTNGSVYLNVLKHEAFHKVWNEFISQDVKNEIVKAFIRTLSKEEQISLNEFSLEELSGLLEERIARKYQVHDKNDKKSFFNKLYTIIKEIYRFITNKQSDIEHYFNLIDFGYFSKKSNQFSGIRDYSGIIKDFQTIDNYINAKDFISQYYKLYSSTGANKTHIPLSQQEINGHIIKAIKVLQIKANNFITEHADRYKDGTLSEDLMKTYESASSKLKWVNLLLEEKNSVPYKVSKILDEILPGRKDNNLWKGIVGDNEVLERVISKYSDDTEQDVDDEYDDVEQDQKPGIEAPFEQNSDKHDRETKLFASIKHFLSTIKNLNNNEFIDSRVAFLKLFKMMEGLDNASSDILFDIRSRISKSITKGNKILSDSELLKYNKIDVSIYFAIKDLYEKATAESYMPEFVKQDNSLLNSQLRNDILIILGRNGDVSSIVINKSGKDISGLVMNQIDKNDNVIINTKDLKISKNNKHEELVLNAINISKSNGVDVAVHEVAALMRKEISRNMFVELQNTFTSLRESNLTNAIVSSSLKGVSYDMTFGGTSEKNQVKAKALKARVIDRFPSEGSLKYWLDRNKKVFVVDSIRKQISSESDRNAKISYIMNFMKSFGLINESTKIDLSLTPDAIIDWISNDIYYAVSTNIDKILFKDKKDDKIDDQIDDENIAVNSVDLIDNIFSKESDLFENIISLLTEDKTRHTTGTFRDASGKKRYTITMTQFADKIIKRYMVDKSNIADYFKTEFMKNNFIMMGVQKISKFYLHGAINYKSNLFGDNIIEFDSEGFEQFIHRTVFVNFFSKFKKGKNNVATYSQPVYIKSNRGDTQYGQMNVLTEDVLLNTVVESIFNQFTSQDLNVLNKWGINPISFVNMGVMLDAIKSAYGDKFSNELLISFVENKVKFKDLGGEIISAIKNYISSEFINQAESLASRIIESNIRLDSEMKSIYENILKYNGDKDASKKANEIFEKFDSGQFSGDNQRATNSGVYSNRSEMLVEPLKLFLMNYYFNGYALNQMFSSNMNTFGTGEKMLKRMSIIFGPGLSLTVGENGIKEKARVMVVSDPTYGNEEKSAWFNAFKKAGVEKDIVKYLKEKNDDKGNRINYADGQGYITPKRYEELIRGIGTTYGLANVGKPIWYDIDEDGIAHAIKYSWIVLSDDLISKDTSGELGKIRRLMDNKNIDELVFESAMKFGIPKNTVSYESIMNESYDDTVENSVIEMSNASYRMQLNPWHEFGDNQVALPSQMMFILNIMEKNVKNARLAYNAMSEIIKIGLNGLKKDMMDNGSFNRKKIEKVVDKKLKSAKSAEIESSMREDEISYDFPTLSNKAFSQIMSLFKRETVGARLRGGKAILAASAGHRNKNGDELSFNIVDQNGKKIIVAEALISKEAAKEILSNEQFKHLSEWIDSKDTNPELIFANGDLLGFRIPSSELHSGVALNIVGWLDEGSASIVVPQRVVEIHGSDFDVDSLFVLGKDVIRDKFGNVVNYQYQHGSWSYKILSEDELGKLGSKDKVRYYKNLISELLLDSVADVKNIKRTQSPISIQMIRDEIDSIIKETNMSKNKFGLDLSKFADSFRAHQSSHDGSAGVGIFANGFKVLSYIITSGKHGFIPDLKDPFSYNGKSISEFSNDIKVWEVMDALINASVDNVKEQVLPFFNLNTNTMASFMAMVSTTGFEFASRMSIQPFFKTISEIKGVRNAGYKQAHKLIIDISEILGENELEAEYSDVTKDELISSIKLSDKLNIKNLKELKSALRNEKTDDIVELAKYQVKLFRIFSKYKKLGESLTSLSSVLSVLRDVPTKMEDVESKIDDFNSIFDAIVVEDGNDKVVNASYAIENNLNFKLVSKESFPIVLEEFGTSAPHMISAYKMLLESRSAAKELLFKHSDIVESAIDIVMNRESIDSVFQSDDEIESGESRQDEISQDIINNAKNRNSIKDSLIQWLMNSLNWDNTFGGYDNQKDVKIKIGDSEYVVSGQDAFKKNFSEKIIVIKKHLMSIGVQNLFLDNLVGSKNINGIEEWTMPNSIDFKSEDILRLKQSFNDLCKYDIILDNDKWIVEEVNDLNYKEWQRDFVRYGLLSNGMSFGATSYSLALPTDLYKKLAFSLDKMIIGMKLNERLLKNNIYRFYNQYLMNNISLVKQYKSKPVQSNGTYYNSVMASINGVETEVFYDIKVPVIEDSKIPDIMMRTGNKISSLYKKVAVVDGFIYFIKLGSSRRGVIYNTTEDQIYSAKDLSYDNNLEKIHNYDNTISESIWNNLSDDVKSRILYDLNIDKTVPNVSVINNRESKFSIPKDMWKFLSNRFGLNNTFRIGVRNNTDVSMSNIRYINVVLAGNEDSHMIYEQNNYIEWDNIKNKKFIKENNVTEEDWNSMTTEEKLHELSCRG